MDRRPDPGALKVKQKFKNVEIPQRQREIESEIEVAVAIVVNVMPQPAGIRGIMNDIDRAKIAATAMTVATANMAIDWPEPDHNRDKLRTIPSAR
jgi:hypothetical protein